MGISFLLLGAIVLQLLAGTGLLVAALAMIAAHGWPAAMENRSDGHWSLARKFLIAGGMLISLATFETGGLAVLTIA